MGTQSTSYITREAALKSIKKDFKRRGWWQETKKIVKSLDNGKLEDLLDRVIDSTFENFCISEERKENDFSYFYDQRIKPKHDGYYIELTIEDVLNW